jgi:hypothetical protein
LSARVPPEGRDKVVRAAGTYPKPGRTAGIGYLFAPSTLQSTSD